MDIEQIFALLSRNYVGSNRFSVGPSLMIAIINRLVNSV